MNQPDSDHPNRRERERLPRKMQLGGFALGLGLTALLLAGTYQLVSLAKEQPPSDAPPANFTVLLWAATAGFVGGAGRALYRFIWEVGDCAPKPALWHLNRWFLYLFKPAMGIAGGLFFFLAVNMGIVGLFSDQGPALKFLRVCLTAVLGGMFFEDVFVKLSKIMRNNGDSE